MAYGRSRRTNMNTNRTMSRRNRYQRGGRTGQGAPDYVRGRRFAGGRRQATSGGGEMSDTPFRKRYHERRRRIRKPSQGKQYGGDMRRMMNDNGYQTGGMTSRGGRGASGAVPGRGGKGASGDAVISSRRLGVGGRRLPGANNVISDYRYGVPPHSPNPPTV